MKSYGPIDTPISFPLVVLGSVFTNAVLWVSLGFGSNQPVHITAPPELVFDRVTVEKNPVTAKPIFHPIQPKPKPPAMPPKKEEPKPIPKPETKPPEGAHNKIVTAKPSPTPQPNDPFTAPAGGNAKLGNPTDGQNAGNAVVNPIKPPDPVTPPPKPAAPPVTAPKVDTPPPVAPKHDDPPVVKPTPPTPPATAPKPKGETREASALHQENVEIPENLKSQTFKSFVRVRVNISADGKSTDVLRTSSGNTDIDKVVLDTLNKWTWKPALKDGEPIDSVQQFRFNFTIE